MDAGGEEREARGSRHIPGSAITGFCGKNRVDKTVCRGALKKPEDANPQAYWPRT